MTDAISEELRAIRAEAIRSRGFLRAAETQLSKVIAAVDAAEMGPSEPAPQPTPEPTPEPEPAPTGLVRLGTPEFPKNTIDEIQRQLDAGNSVEVPAGSFYEGSLTIPGSTQRLGVWGEGPRPVLNVPLGKHGIEATSDYIDLVEIEEWAVYGPHELQRDWCGIRLRLNGSDGKYAKRFIVRDCKVQGFDDLVQVVDDWARKQPAGTPGRIGFRLYDSILTDAYSSDAHGSGLYVEGLSEDSDSVGNVIWRVSWTEDGRDPRTKMGHCIYAQEFGAPFPVRDTYLGEACAAGMMMRRGGVAERVIISGCATPYVAFGSASSLTDSAIIDQRDIDPDDPDLLRLRAVNVWSVPSFKMHGVVMARRHGKSLNRPVVEISGSNLDIQDNVVAEWPTNIETYRIGGMVMDEEDGNRILDDATGVPEIDEAMLNRLRTRERGMKWSENDTPLAFIQRAQQATNKE